MLGRRGGAWSGELSAETAPTKWERGELRMARYTWAAMLTLLATTALPTYGADSTSADVQAITAIEHGWTDAMKAQDYAFLEKHLSEDFTYTGETGGFAKDRTAYIENGAKKAPKIVEISMSDELVRVHGTT